MARSAAGYHPLPGLTGHANVKVGLANKIVYREHDAMMRMFRIGAPIVSQDEPVWLYLRSQGVKLLESVFIQSTPSP